MGARPHMLMDSEIFEKYKKAGKVNIKAKNLVEKLAKPGAKVLDIAEKVENLIKEEGARLAFPANISINNIAAHYTPDYECKIVLGEDDLVKFDLGVQVDGFIADSAITITTNPKNDLHVKLIEAAQKSLEKAIELVKPGVKIEKIGETIENTMKSFGVKPIENLTGHGVGQYVQHDEPIIPNVKKSGGILEEGMSIAIEPFSTNGEGLVYDDKEVQIYEFIAKIPVRLMEARRILMMAEKDFEKLPFAKRWIEKKIGKLKLALAFRELNQFGALYQYPVLKEKGNGLVAQFEHTMVVQKDGAFVTTMGQK
ncbi:TPA: type II methionyl aminopeptidase [archaeon]|nr:type II methionyl aminopeptidase [Candidatus Naiadarchaeales archaeon SRR2090153.bin1042]